MQRVTISLDEQLATAFDALVAGQGYASRSEAVRDLVRRAVDAPLLHVDSHELCVANLSYVYDHHTRALAQRLTDLEHHHVNLVVSTTHVHLDHERCLESTILRGPPKAIWKLGETIMAERGVRFGMINVISEGEASRHAASGHA